MKQEFLTLSEDGVVHMTAYLHEPSPELPRWDKRPAVLVLPGGAYMATSDREADPVVFSFLAQGFHALLLRYSVGARATYPNPLIDVSRAVATIREHADDWGVLPDQIAVCGFSAGGHLAASLGTLWNDAEIEQAAGVSGAANRPNALILGYPVIAGRHQPMGNWFTQEMDEADRERIRQKLSCEMHVGPHTPPTFLFHTYADELVPVEHSLLFAQALVQADIPCELHLFQRGSHGASLANALTYGGHGPLTEASLTQWLPLATTWLWRLFGQPGSLAEAPSRMRRAHFGDPGPRDVLEGKTERYAETGRFTLYTVLGDVLDDSRARAVL